MKIETKLLGRGLIVSTVGPLSPTGEAEYETIVFHRETGGRAWVRHTYGNQKGASIGHETVVSYWKNRPRSEIRSRLAIYKRKKA